MLRLVPAGVDDLDAIVRLNEAAVPAVNSVDEGFFREMHALSESFLAARLGNGLVGFLLLLPADVDYASPNYRWFSRRYDEFLYVDRVVVATTAKRRGVGRAFYEAAWARARARGVALTCEVNVEPPNPESMAFHEAFGFRAVGAQRTEGGAKAVSLMAREPDD